MTVNVNRENFDHEVLQCKGLVLVDFWGPQCGPCLALMPAVEKIAADYAAHIKVAKVNATENRMLCAQLRVLKLPTFLLYRDGAEVKRLTGEPLIARDIQNTIADAIGS